MEDFNFLIGLIKQYGYWIIALMVFAESMGIPLPGETMLVLGGGIMTSLGYLNVWTVIIVTIIAAVLGDNLGYLIGEKYGKKIVQKLLAKKWLSPKRVQEVEKFFADYGNKTVFIGRFIAIMRTYVAFFAGIFRLPYPTFLVYNLAGSIVWSITFGLLGYFIGNNLNLLYSIITDFKEIIIAGLLLLAVYLLIRKYFSRKK